jgi:phage terminase large subunit-like protein
MARKPQLSVLDEIRQLAEADLLTFAKIVNPQYMYGEVHEEVFRWMSRPEAKNNQLVLLPRGHLKSHMVAVWCAWWITKHPETTILYVSATSTLAEAQLLAIKNMLDNPNYKRYWPDMLHEDVGKRARWTTGEIIVDHPKRTSEGIRDATLKAVGLSSTTTGLHADVIVADDVVVPDNAYTEDGRYKVSAAMSQMASIKNAGGLTKAVGTRYHPQDLYHTWKNQKKRVYDFEGNLEGEEEVWEIFERVVEIDGKFLWEREMRADGKAYGFNWNILAGIEAEYEDRNQYFSQYYNNPNASGTERISRNKFQYYDKRFLQQKAGNWYFKERRLNVYAAMDFAFSINKKADWTAIVVVGVDSERNYYILDIDRFKTDKIKEYYDHIFQMYSKWEFRRIRLECTVAQSVIVKDLKDSYIKPNGLALSIDESKPTKNKEERVAAVLEPKYDNMQVWHFRGGYMADLEDELVMAKPPHDDLKDALASCLETVIPPARNTSGNTIKGNVVFNSRFGGVAA